MYVLTLASAIFYGASGWSNLLVLAASITVNFLAGRTLLELASGMARQRRTVMWLAVAANVALLLTFKIRVLTAEGPDGFTVIEDVLLPLALSFITFQQIGFITGCYRGTITTVSLERYLFFVLFFPQLILGPIVRFEDFARQLDDDALGRVDPGWLATGISVFSLGLVKKAVLADLLAVPVDRVFAEAQQAPIAMGEAWFAIVTFQFQMFFDFTAYAEMAIGLAMMVGMKVPLNFDCPLFARDRADLWRRWHISFATFIRGNVFLPLAKHWRWPVPAALAATGILSGLWHGLGPTFVLWGLLQTSILLFLHWRTDARRRTGRNPLPVPLAIAATFLVTCLLGALFRSPTLATAANIYGGLLNVNSVVPLLLEMHWGYLSAFAAGLIWIAPDAGQIFRNHWRYTELRARPKPPPVHWCEGVMGFRPNAAWGVITALMLVAGLITILVQDHAERFVYVQF